MLKSIGYRNGDSFEVNFNPWGEDDSYHSNQISEGIDNKYDKVPLKYRLAVKNVLQVVPSQNIEALLRLFRSNERFFSILNKKF